MAAEKIALNLNQRRTVQQFEEKFKQWKEDFDKTCGCSIPIECEWDSFFVKTDNMTPETIMKNWQEFYFGTLTATFELICTDSMGKEAVKNGVKKIMVTGADTTDYRLTTFKDGVFHVNHSAGQYSSSVKERAAKWQKTIEGAL